MYKKTVLDNGLKIVTEIVPQFKSATLGFWINVGSQYEKESNNGISHFIEHILFKGTKKLSAKKIAEKIDNLGGVLNAFTEKEHTCFYTKVMDRHLSLAIDILVDMLLNSTLNTKDIQTEKAVILDEIRMYEDSPDEIIFELFSKSIWGDTSLGQPTLGRREIILALDKVKIKEFIKKNYAPSNIIVSAAGGVDHLKIVKQISRYFNRGAKIYAGVKNKERYKVMPRKIVKERPCEQVYLCWGGRGITQLDRRRYVMVVLDSVLGGSLSSRLFQEIREKRGLVYSISSFQNSYLHTGAYGVQASTSSENFNKVIELIKKSLDKIMSEGITKEELARTKEHLKGAISLGLENTASRMMRLAKSEHYHKRYISYEEVIKKIEEVSIDDVHQIAREVLNYKNFSLAVIGPVNKIKSGYFKF